MTPDADIKQCGYCGALIYPAMPYIEIRSGTADNPGTTICCECSSLVGDESPACLTGGSKE